MQASQQPSGVSAQSVSPRLRSFIYLTAAVNGAAIMIVEILGAKMLAPFMGTSHFVWTAQIGVAMASLAAGYYVGGRWADTAAHVSRLFGAMLAAALYLAVGIFGVRPVAERCIELPLPVASLLASIFLFFIPLALLAMTGPFLVRFITAHLQGVGGNVGRLSAVSTVGSLAGTALIGYVLLPLAPNSVTLLGTAGVIALVAGGYFACWGRRRLPAVAAVAATFGLGALAVRADLKPPFSLVVEVHRSNSDFGQLQVLDAIQVPTRLYLNDYLIQNTYDRNSKQSLSLFTYGLHDLAVAHTERIDSVLCIGVGVGIVPGQFAAEGVRVDAVEINPAVVPVAEKYFDFVPARLHLTIADGRQFLNGNTNRYDAVILDAFLGDSLPSHLMTIEAFTAMRAVMNSNAVLVINCFGDRQPGKDFLVTSLQKTLRAVFGHVQLHDIGTGNLFFVASPSPLQLRRTLDPAHVHPSVLSDWHRLLPAIVEADPNRGQILTDDFNPVDYFDAANREHGRRELARGMRQM